MSVRVWLASFLLVATACGEDDPGGSGAPRGPADAIIELDVASIPLPTAPPQDGGVAPDTSTPVADTGAPATDTPLRCTGTPTPCSLLNKSLCDLTLGCIRDKDCSGYPGSCYGQSDSYSCTRIKGCYWSTLNKSCSGSANPCSLYSDDYSCTSQRNCTFRDECTGVPSSCSSMPILDCLSQAGCRLE